ncbi:DNA repair exonuclease [Sphaerochaeta sp. PS]|uniref:metallophosphoesterase family protein n=1 Tax=Sphaerochaeta sp. PS TaxID=3076336 RepID=UPI0028A54928|nr:DNA repair exonuclease [Sphaerochaeta sp. PS]MDT4761680.1 DNA repair exonuclease [Sphaerochaeta sp. PS]
MKILCCADIHMGRIPSVPYVGGLTSHASWDAIVEKALEIRADVLVLAGDVVDQEENWFEAYGPLVSGLEKLGKAGIQVIGVGGNHDYSVFPSLAKESPYIRILGLGETWQHYDYMGVRFVGWSFAARSSRQNPFASFDASLTDSDLPLLGLLHCDFGGAQGSAYAPVSAHDLTRSSIPWWVLGHIHKGGIQKGGNGFYCGSPYALDSNEDGPHGIWLLEREEMGPWKEPILLQLCPYRFASLPVSLEGAKDGEDVRRILSQTLREHAKLLSFAGTLLCSLTLEGRVDRTLDVGKALSEEDLTVFSLTEGETVVHTLASYTDATELDVDLEELAKGGGAKALLAQKLLDEGELEKMVEAYKKLEKESYTASAFSLLHSSHTPKSDAEYLFLVRQAAKKLLFSMIATEQGGQG